MVILSNVLKIDCQIIKNNFIGNNNVLIILNIYFNNVCFNYNFVIFLILFIESTNFISINNYKFDNPFTLKLFNKFIKLIIINKCLINYSNLQII